MESLYLLIPLSAVLVFVILGVFARALAGGQFDNLEVEGERILVDAAPAGDGTPPRGHVPDHRTRE